MAKAFSVASWNVEHFGDEQPTAAERLEFLVEQEPDVIGLYEVEGAEVWRELMRAFPGYSFFITEGENTQEILVGVAPHLTGFVTQKIQFQDSLSKMRPGAFLTIRLDDVDYSLLFLHVASWTAPRGFGLRAEMIDKAFQFKRYLDERSEDGTSNFLFCGDLNTMGLDYIHGREPPPDDRRLIHSRFDAELEIERLRHLGRETGMRVLEKTADVTWGKETGARSDLDHVVASDQLSFRDFDGAQVDVRGWPTLETKEEQATWMSTYSDHALLYFELERLD
jgi:hypothetical protein